MYPSEKDSLNAMSFVDSIKIKTTNDPGLLDSIAISLKANNNISGNYENIEIENFPLSIKSFLKKEKTIASLLYYMKMDLFIFYINIHI